MATKNGHWPATPQDTSCSLREDVPRQRSSNYANTRLCISLQAVRRCLLEQASRVFSSHRPFHRCVLAEQCKVTMLAQKIQRRQVLCAPVAVRAAAPANRAVAVRAAVATEENAGDVAWNKTYYPKLVDAAKSEKDWYESAGLIVICSWTVASPRSSPRDGLQMDCNTRRTVIRKDSISLNCHGASCERVLWSHRSERSTVVAAAICCRSRPQVLSVLELGVANTIHCSKIEDISSFASYSRL